MEIFKTIESLNAFLELKRQKNAKIGFVPTMGALHDGHLSLLHRAKQETDCSVCSIFVNPTQFNDPNDLANYPKPIENDLKLLKDLNVDVAFCPEILTIYPQNDVITQFDLAGLDKFAEGADRPGHFQGVATVVAKLLDIVNPHFLYMGQKDLQQCRIVQQLIDGYVFKTQPKLVICPTLREPNGLAMSSRNIRLSIKGRQEASSIYKSMLWAKQNFYNYPIQELLNQVCLQLKQINNLEIGYVYLIDYKNFKPLQTFENVLNPALCIAVTLEGVRLIDNLFLND